MDQECVTHLGLVVLFYQSLPAICQLEILDYHSSFIVVTLTKCECLNLAS